MLTKEEQELVTRTGPGTPMGELFRRFWLPVMLSEELVAPGCPPVRLRIMNEDLVAFKDREGRIGIIDAYCPHRFSPMFFGRNEDDGLRCVYHGWKYDVTGACMEMPFVPEGETFRHKVRIKSYPAVEKGGFIWCYMGPPEKQPPVPPWEFMEIPESHRENWKIVVECNWLQSMEGQNDPTHGYYTHGFIDPALDPGLQIFGDNRLQRRRNFEMMLPKLVEDTEYGVRWAREWDAGDGEKWVDIGHWVMPVFDPSPGNNAGPRSSARNLGYSRMRVPIDDTNAMVMRVRWDRERPLPPEWREAHNTWLVPEMIPGTYKPVANKSNDYMINRVLQKRFTYTGINGFPLQDIALIESQGGPIMDRTRETLNSGDMINIHIRSQLIKAARALQEGKEPAPPHHPEHFLVRGGAFKVPIDKPLKEAVHEMVPQLVAAPQPVAVG